MALIPYIKSSPRKTLTIPELGGGINLRDSVSTINDNQMTDCLNVCFHEGMLRTRPALSAKPYCSEYLLSKEGQTDTQIVREIPNEVRLIIGEKEYFLNAYIIVKDTDAEIRFKLVSFDGNSLGVAGITVSDTSAKAFVVQHKTNIYCFVSGQRTEHVIYKLSKDRSSWNAVTQDDIYIPIVMTNCKSDNTLNMTTAEIKSNGGEEYEGYNLLSSYYRMIYSTVNLSVLSDDDPEQIREQNRLLSDTLLLVQKSTKQLSAAVQMLTIITCLRLRLQTVGRG